MLCLDGRRSLQRADRIQRVGAILGKAQADRKRNRDCFARRRAKRPETGPLERMATRDTQRMRNRYRDQTGPIRALCFCHVDPGALFELGLLSDAGMQHERNSASTDECVAPTSRLRRNLSARRWTANASSGSHGVTIIRQTHEAGCPLLRKTKHPSLGTVSRVSLLCLPIAELLSLFFGIMTCADRHSDRWRQLLILRWCTPPLTSTLLWNLECLGDIQRKGGTRVDRSWARDRMSEALSVVYLARHGETAWSLSGQHTGLTDLPLTSNGERNARRLGERLKGMTFAKVFTSPLQRAARTCELAGYGTAAETDPDLVEWNYGQYEGLRSAEILAKRPDWQLFRDGAPGGESPAQVGERADRVVQSIRTVPGDVLLFSSGHFIRVFADRWLGRDPGYAGRYLLLSTASLSAVGYEHNLSQPVIRFWNDDHHVSA